MVFLFTKVAEVYSKLESVSSGNKMREILSDLFKIVPYEEIDVVVYLSSGRIASEFEDINFGIAEKMVMKSLAFASKKSVNEIESMFRKKGDLGDVAELIIGKAHGTLYVQELFDILHKIAKYSGSGSQNQKIKLIANILEKASPLESKYIIRIVLGTMRLGVGTMTILDSLSIAYTDKKENKKILESAYNICPDIGIIAKILATKSLSGIEKIDVMVGRPIKMMLASRIETLEELHEKMQRVAAEQKYDGERVQIHNDGKNIVLFSRRLENITSQFPDIVEFAKNNIKAKSYIVEGEIVPVDAEGNILPFQILMQRRRKYSVEEYMKKVPVCLFLFELLYLNNKSYLNEPYLNRRNALALIVKPQPNKIKLANQLLTDDLQKIKQFFLECLKHGGEGIVAKSLALSSVYQAGTRGLFWIKWKKEYVKEMSDTFDLVVVGAFYGRGRRSGSYGALLCASYNDSAERYETFCKLGTGFSDKQLKDMPKCLKEYVSLKQPKNVVASNLMKPDVWFLPHIVIEVFGAEITKSQSHTCAKFVEQGLALRFPRFLRYRDDKRAEQATTSEEILKMHKQKTKK